MGWQISYKAQITFVNNGVANLLQSLVDSREKLGPPTKGALTRKEEGKESEGEGEVRPAKEGDGISRWLKLWVSALWSDVVCLYDPLARPPAPASPGLPFEAPSVLIFNVPTGGVVHLIICIRGHSGDDGAGRKGREGGSIEGLENRRTPLGGKNWR
ncbi:WD domain [Striga asiatica]|uniref:WD domain n=1 Tax=Striga asiatica TaxID=4170 RepID=A0A5A7QBE5_STRAF|nr:WD domain [Striga asiatica]